MIKENMQEYIPKGAKPETKGNSIMFEVSVLQVKEIVRDLYHNKKLSLKLVTATDERKEHECFKVWYIFGVPGENMFVIPYIKLKDSTDFPSLALTIPKISNYERKIKTFFGLRPVGHPDLRPIILHENWPSNIFPLRKDFDWQIKPKDANGKYEFQEVKGEGIYEIPVGPIHAGIIEPGHFRFSVAGESIVLLEPKLGFVHKGSEKLFEVLGMEDKVRLSEKISGDSSFGHSLAFCQAVENLGSVDVPKRAQYLRSIYAELERLANHFGDIGAIMIDTGFSFGGSNGARLREIIMRINERISGSRFLRGVNIIGGVSKDISDNEKINLGEDLTKILKDFSEVIDVAENSASLLNRLKGTGTIFHETARFRGLVGVAGRASGKSIDVRVNYPYAGYKDISLTEIPIETTGDVNARFHVRIKEVYASIELIHKFLQKLPKGHINVSNLKISLEKNSVATSLVEGWRGEIVYFVTTDSHGNVSRVAPRDPSFINWDALGYAGFDNIVPDFPLINKSFNLSYSGNDL